MNAEAIRRRIRNALRASRLNQEQVARLLGISRPAISAIENCKRDVTAHELFLICSIANIEPNEMLGWNTPKAEVPLELPI